MLVLPVRLDPLATDGHALKIGDSITSQRWTLCREAIADFELGGKLIRKGSRWVSVISLWLDTLTCKHCVQIL